MAIRRALAAFLIALAAGPALSQQNSSAEAPFAPKAFHADRLQLPVDAAIDTAIVLPLLEPGIVDAIREANSATFTKRLQIGVGRAIKSEKASGRALQWVPAAQGLAARWAVTSPEARALRVALDADKLPPGSELRFASRSRPDVVYGPFTQADIASAEGRYWSPVLEGDTALVEIQLPAGADPSTLALDVVLASHLFVNPAQAGAESAAKASGFCEVDLICLSANDNELASAGRSVAKMTFSEGSGGGTFLCTGTLLNPVGGSLTPYFYSAAHCISTQAAASTLTTYWFYDRNGCGSGGTSANYVQLPGGATLLYANTYADALLLRLNASPPAGAVFSGWDASTLSSSALTAIHHPAGDLKKVSLGSFGGFGSYTSSDTNFIVANWNSTATGVTEGGSSGSGLFTLASSPREYRLRGGLYGGPSSCSAPASDLHDYYSRLDQVYPAIAQYLDPGTASCSYTLSPTSVTVGADAATGSVSVTAGSGCAWSATSDSTWLTTSSSASGNGTLTYSVAANGGAIRVGNITVGGQRFTVTQQAPLSTGTNLVSNAGFEQGTAAWTETATGGYPIITNGSRAHAGSWYAWLGGYDNAVDTLYQLVTVPSQATQATIRFWYFIETFESATGVAYDTMTISIADPASGATLATLATFSNVNAASGWVQSAAYDVSAFRGRTVRLVFRGTTDFSNITNFYVDDITLSAGGGNANYTALWWNPSESGWGINLSHQGNIVFATLYTYDTNGQPLWLFMSNGDKQADGSFQGALYRAVGPPFNASPWGSYTATQVGTMRLAFSSPDAGVLTYSVNGANVVKNITRYQFSNPTTCTFTTADRSTSTNYQDLWWNPAESGWGVNLAHQGNILFATLYTYDASGQPLWLSMSNGPLVGTRTYSGTLYRSTGPVFNANPWGAYALQAVGTMTFVFTNGNNGTLTYSVNGIQVVKSIQRFVFATPVNLCSGS